MDFSKTFNPRDTWSPPTEKRGKGSKGGEHIISQPRHPQPSMTSLVQNQSSASSSQRMAIAPPFLPEPLHLTTTTLQPEATGLLPALTSPVIPLTRVMSPSAGESSMVFGDTLPRGMRLQGATKCIVCIGDMTEIWVCPYCYCYGHPWCLNASVLDGWVVCGNCLPEAESQYRQHLADQQVSCWQQSLQDQVAQWKSTMVTATGVLSTVGLTLGGTGAVLASGATALVKGAAIGLATASSPSKPMMARSFSADLLPITGAAEEDEEHCLKCAGVQSVRGRKTTHTYKGNCTGLPFDVWIKRGKTTQVVPTQVVPTQVVPIQVVPTQVVSAPSAPTTTVQAEEQLDEVSFATGEEQASGPPNSMDLLGLECSPSPVKLEMSSMQHPSEVVDSLLGMQTQLAGMMTMVSELHLTVHNELLPDFRHYVDRQVAAETINADMAMRVDGMERTMTEVQVRSADTAGCTQQILSRLEHLEEQMAEWNQASYAGGEAGQAEFDLEEALGGILEGDRQVEGPGFQWDRRSVPTFGMDSDGSSRDNSSTPSLGKGEVVEENMQPTGHGTMWQHGGFRTPPFRTDTGELSTTPFASLSGAGTEAAWRVPARQQDMQQQQQQQHQPVAPVYLTYGDDRIAAYHVPPGMRRQSNIPQDRPTISANGVGPMGTQSPASPPTFPSLRTHRSVPQTEFPGYLGEAPDPARSLLTSGSRQASLPGLGSLAAVGQPQQDEEDVDLGHQELNILMKFLTSMPELPKIEVGDVGTRGEKLQLWLVNMKTQLKATRPCVVSWWEWSNDKADELYQHWLKAHPTERMHLKIECALPRRWETVEGLMKPKLLKTMPPKLEEEVKQERVYGMDDRVVDILYKLLKMMKPGSLEEQDHLLKRLTTPDPCSKPQTALKELFKWYAAVQRCQELHVTLPGVELLYRGARSIYGSIFDDNDDFSLRLRWTQHEQSFGFPHRLTHEGLKGINEFAQGELTALVTSGRQTANTSLPLTDTQRARNKGEKEAGAKAKAARTNASVRTPSPVTAAGVMIDGKHYSATVNKWCQPCDSWTKHGHCPRACACWFRHDGFETHGPDGKTVDRYINCGKQGHGTKDCFAPGGSKSVNKDKE